MKLTAGTAVARASSSIASVVRFSRPQLIGQLVRQRETVSMGITTRRATESDAAFLRRLHREAMAPHVAAAWGAWNDADQARHFAKAPLEQHDLVLLDERPIGCLLVRREADALVLSRIWLLPTEQGRGLGTQLVTRLCERAAQEGLAVRLRVLKVNPAHRLYARLGFRLTQESETHFSMERAA